MKYKGRIVEIDKHQNRTTYLTTAVGKSSQHLYANYPGDNGTYVTGGDYLGTSLNIKIFIFDLDESLSFDVYNQVLLLKGNRRISSQLLKEIESHCGEKVDVSTSDTLNFSFDISQII
ncbi:hypothetical protein K2F40_15470 [Clostridium sp. CM028]|uniref:hypothetical protein n=1 Tax=Clostridium sp. CM028 TaxID=2851575 RepID=UPI001C6E81CC|nr:hypothetical protein [Clostridium sp. CM028]MBW9150358.1 hypothetical protein [Clostridium sp. CM028]WLC63535.1 hypothetical protein KTC94_17480 [Clostridium sp. CM028]